MQLITKAKKNQQIFLSTIPNLSFKSILQKIIITALIGFILSIAFVIWSIWAFKIDRLGTINAFIVMKILQDIPFLLIVIFIFYKGRLGELKKIFVKPTFNKTTGIFILLFILIDLFLVTTVYIIVFSRSNDPQSLNSLQVSLNSGPDRITISYIFSLIGYFSLYILLAFTEEFVFRFTIYRFLRKYGLYLSLFITSVLFATIHTTDYHIILIPFIFSVLIALFYEYTNSFWGTVIVHAISNQFIRFYAMYFTYLLIK